MKIFAWILLLLLSPWWAGATASTSEDVPVAQNSNNAPNTSGSGKLAVQFLPIEYAGCAVFRVENTTTPVQIVSGAGLFYELDVSSGVAASSFSMAFDSGSISGLAVSNNNTGPVNNLPTGKSITPKVFTSATSNTVPSAAQGSAVGVYVSVDGLAPKYFATGLVVANSDAGIMANGCYRLIGGNNPPP